MIMNNDKSIGKIQLIFLIIQTQIGIGVLNMPYRVQETAKQDSWISVLVAGAFIQVIIIFLYLLVKRFPNFTIYEFSSKIIGNLFGKLISFTYIIYFLSTAILITVLFTNVLKLWVFTTTPRWVLYLIGISIAIYLAKENINVISRFFTLSGVILLMLIAIISVKYGGYTDFRFLFPIANHGITPILQGAQKVLISFGGFEALLVYFSFVKPEDKKNILKALLLGNSFIIFLYTYLVFTSLVVFSPQELATIKHPVLYMLKSLTINIVDRLDLLFLSIWSVTFLNTLISYLYLASLGVSTIFHKQQHRIPVYYNAILIFIIALFFQDQFSIKAFNNIITYFTIITIIFIPLMLLVITIIRKQKSKGETG